jgi:hypothetical protein
MIATRYAICACLRHIALCVCWGCRWGFEATEPHIYSYYEQNVKSLLVKGGFDGVEEHENDPYNHGWFGKKPLEVWDI